MVVGLAPDQHTALLSRSVVRGAAQLALRRIVVDAARASKLPSLTAGQRTEWRERAEVWADTAAGEFASDLVALLPDGVLERA